MPPRTGLKWEKIDISHLSKQQFFEHLKAVGRILPEVKSYGQRNWSQSSWFFRSYKRGYYWRESNKCLEDTLSPVLKADMWFLAAQIKVCYSSLEGQGRQFIKVNTKDIPDAALLYLLKEVEIIPQDTPSFQCSSLPYNVYTKLWHIKKQGYFRYGRDKRRITININQFVNNINYVNRIIRIALSCYDICDYHEAYSDLYFRAYELSGHPLFLKDKWLFKVMKNRAWVAFQKEGRYYNRFISYEGFIEGDGGELRENRLQQVLNRNII